jgi:hypothetical protein
MDMTTDLMIGFVGTSLQLQLIITAARLLPDEPRTGLSSP